MRTALLLAGLMIEFARILPALSAEPRFSADNVLNGVTWNADRCDGPGRVKVDVGGRLECLRFYGIAPEGARGDPVVFLDGDLVFQAGESTHGQPIWNVHGFYTQLSPALMQTEAERFALSAERIFINLARPGPAPMARPETIASGGVGGKSPSSTRRWIN